MSTKDALTLRERLAKVIVPVIKPYTPLGISTTGLAYAIADAILKRVPILTWCRANPDTAAALAAGTMVGVKAKHPNLPASREHNLKTWPEFYDAIDAGAKTFEARLNDRNYAIGDRLFLNRFDPTTQSYVKGWPPIMRYVTYVLKGGQFGVETGHCILGLATVSPPTSDDGLGGKP